MHDASKPLPIVKNQSFDAPRPGKTKGTFLVRAKWDYFCGKCHQTLLELGHKIPSDDESHGTSFMVTFGVFDVFCACTLGNPRRLFGSPYNVERE